MEADFNEANVIVEVAETWQIEVRETVDPMLLIKFEFVGGPHDGKVVNGAFGEANAAERFFLFSNRGKVGQRFKVASDHAVTVLADALERGDTCSRLPAHYYIVTDCVRDDTEVWVRAEYSRAA